MTESHRIDASGSIETFTIPRHRPGTLTVMVVGGGGKTEIHYLGARYGGIGGGLQGTLNVAEGTTLYCIAGYAATGQAGAGPMLGGQGGDGGDNAPGSNVGLGGGCASEVRTSTAIGDRIAVGGGGGGAGDDNQGPGAGYSGGDGGAGVAAGSDGKPIPRSGNKGEGGTGGTLSAPGTGGPGVVTSPTVPNGDGDDGSAGTGGDGGWSHLSSGLGSPGGGGGGGYYGGGGGGGGTYLGGGGGGGSSWADTGLISDITAAHAGTPDGSAGQPEDDGFVLFTWEPIRGGWSVGMIRG